MWDAMRLRVSSPSGSSAGAVGCVWGTVRRSRARWSPQLSCSSTPVPRTRCAQSRRSFVLRILCRSPSDDAAAIPQPGQRRAPSANILLLLPAWILEGGAGTAPAAPEPGCVLGPCGRRAPAKPDCCNRTSAVLGWAHPGDCSPPGGTAAGGWQGIRSALPPHVGLQLLWRPHSAIGWDV